MPHQWTQNHQVNLNGRYTTPLIANYRHIQTFLTTEAAVRWALDQLVTATQGLTSHAAFETWLLQREAAFGFNPNVISIQGGVIDSEVFLSYIAAKRPMLDIGAGTQHGFNTHRVQFVMIGLMAEAQPSMLTESVVELYRQLGASGDTRRLTDPNTLAIEYLWDDVFDRLYNVPTRNATCPEYLRDVYVEQDYPTLAAIWR